MSIEGLQEEYVSALIARVQIGLAMVRHPGQDNLAEAFLDAKAAEQAAAKRLNLSIASYLETIDEAA